jgi:hypothetical protein
MSESLPNGEFDEAVLDRLEEVILGSRGKVGWISPRDTARAVLSTLSQTHTIAPKSNYNSLQDRLSDIVALCWGYYDGFDTIEGLKSLIDDVVKVAKGEMGVIDTKGVPHVTG